MERVKGILVEALRQAAASSGAQRLYRSGKLPGIFPSRSSLHIEAATQAVRDGLIEIVRSEAKGKTVVEWAQVTPQGIQFVLDHDSPIRAMDELHALLQTNAAGMPRWLEQIRQQLDELGHSFLKELDGFRARFEHLTERVQEGLRRTDKFGCDLPEGTAGSIPWTRTLVDYLERRREGGIGERCPLPELFAHVRGHDAHLTIQDFHHGLRRLHDRGTVRLCPHDGLGGPPEPEYALLDGAMVYWYAAR